MSLGREKSASVSSIPAAGWASNFRSAIACMRPYHREGLRMRASPARGSRHKYACSAVIVIMHSIARFWKAEKMPRRGDWRAPAVQVRRLPLVTSTAARVTNSLDCVTLLTTNEFDRPILLDRFLFPRPPTLHIYKAALPVSRHRATFRRSLLCLTLPHSGGYCRRSFLSCRTTRSSVDKPKIRVFEFDSTKMEGFPRF